MLTFIPLSLPIQSQLLKNNPKPIKVQVKSHLYGNISTVSECNILETNQSILIAPFHLQETYYLKYKIIAWDPRTLKLLKKLPGGRIWKLWNNFYAVITETLVQSKVDILIYTFTKKGMQKIKKIEISIAYDEIKGILGTKPFRTIYIVGQRWVNAIDQNSMIKCCLNSEEKIDKALVSEESKTLVLCSYDTITLNELDERGMIKSPKVSIIHLNNEFVTACLDKDKLIVITIYQTPQTTNVYLSKYELINGNYKDIQRERFLVDLLTIGCRFEFAHENQILICNHETGPFSIVSIKTGKILFSSIREGILFKIRPEKREVITARNNILQKIELDSNIL